MHMLESDHPVPLYEQVKQFITQGIRAGEWGAGGRLPSEIDLVERLGVSRMTVHRALRELMASGVIVRLQGVGTFVSRTTPQSTLLEMRDIAEEIRERGGRHSSDVKVLETLVLDQAMAEKVGLRSGQKVFHSLILHRENNVPVQVEERWINPSVFPEYGRIDFTKITPYQYLTRSARITEVEHIIHAMMPDPTMQDLLDIEAGHPCLLLLRRTWSKTTLATSSRFLFPGQRYTLGSRYKVDGAAAQPKRLVPLKRTRAETAPRAKRLRT